MISDTLLHYAVAYYRDRSDTLSYMRASFAFFGHLHSLDRGKDAMPFWIRLTAMFFGDTKSYDGGKSGTVGIKFQV